MESPSSVGGGGRNRILTQRQHQKHQQQHHQNSLLSTPIINNNNNNTVEESTYTSNRFNNCSPSAFPHFPPPPDYPPPENKHSSTCSGSGGRKVHRYPDDTDTIELCLEDETANNTGSRSFNNCVGRRVGGEGGGQHNIDAQVIYFSFFSLFFSIEKMFNQLKSIFLSGFFLLFFEKISVFV